MSLYKKEIWGLSLIQDREAKSEIFRWWASHL